MLPTTETMLRKTGLLALLVFLFGTQVRAAEIHAMQGLYEDKAGGVAVTTFAEFGNGFFYIDFTGGRIGPVIRKDERIVVGDSLNDPQGDAGALVLMPTGLRAGIDGVPRALRTVPLAREPFTVASGGIDLAGELVHRADRAPKGTIVIVHGSNDSTRMSYGPFVSYLALRGWTVAVFDKRGSGASTGEWTAGGFGELAGDVRAVAAFAHARLAKKKLGLLGISQAGWVMPLAAKDGGFDFIVSLMGPAVTPAQQTMETVAGQLHGYGFTPADIKRATAYYRLDLDVTMGKRRWADIDAAYKRETAAKSEWIVAPPEAQDSPARGFLNRIARFDVAPHWAKVRVPVLAIFGSKDLLVPVTPNRALLGKMLKSDRRAKVVVIAGVNHVGMIAKTGTFAEYVTLGRFDPAFFKTFGDWLEKQAR